MYDGPRSAPWIATAVQRPMTHSTLRHAFWSHGRCPALSGMLPIVLVPQSWPALPAPLPGLRALYSSHGMAIWETAQTPRWSCRQWLLASPPALVVGWFLLGLPLCRALCSYPS